jgi:hypothetical protein
MERDGQQGASVLPAELAAELEPAYQLLIARGFDSAAALALCTLPFDRAPADSPAERARRIERQCAWMAKRPPARNPLGLLRRAIQEDWAEPGRKPERVAERDNARLARVVRAPRSTQNHSGQRRPPEDGASEDTAAAAAAARNEEALQALRAMQQDDPAQWHAFHNYAGRRLRDGYPKIPARMSERLLPARRAELLADWQALDPQDRRPHYPAAPLPAEAPPTEESAAAEESAPTVAALIRASLEQNAP